MSSLKDVVLPAVCVVALPLGCATGAGGGTGFDPSSAGESATTGGAGSTGSTGASGGSSTESSGSSGGASTSGTAGGSTTGGGTTGGGCGLWRTATPGYRVREVVVGPDGAVYAIGGTIDGSQGRVWALDPCDGAILKEADVMQAGHVASDLYAGVFAAGSLFVAGRTSPAAGDYRGLYARLEPGTLAQQWTAPLAGTAELQDAVNKILMLDSGRLWMSGTTGTGAALRPWWISGSDSGQGCGFGWGGGGDASSTRISVADGTTVYTIVDEADGAQLLHFDATCTCMCSPTYTSPKVQIGAVDTQPFDAVLDNGTIYVVGAAVDDVMSPNHRTIGAAIDANTGTITAQVTSDDTLLYDIDTGVALGGGGLMVVRTTGWDGVDLADTGPSARLVRYDLPLIDGASPALDVAIDGLNGALELTWDPATELGYVSGLIAGDGVVVVCDATGSCG